MQPEGSLIQRVRRANSNIYKQNEPTGNRAPGSEILASQRQIARPCCLANRWSYSDERIGVPKLRRLSRTLIFIEDHVGQGKVKGQNASRDLETLHQAHLGPNSDCVPVCIVTVLYEKNKNVS